MKFNPFNFLRPRVDTVVQEAIINKFNQAFLWGGEFTTYDNKGITYLKKGYNINPIVFSVINQQATKTAAVPYYIKTVNDDQSLKKLRRLRHATKFDMSVQQRVQSILLESKAYSKEELAFPMDRPNVTQTWSKWIALYKTFMKTNGNAYMYILAPLEGSNQGEPLQVYWLPSQYTQILLKPNADMLGVESPIKGYILSYGRQYIEFKAANVIHIKYSNPNYSETGEHLYGLSPLQAALKNIQSSNEALDLNIKTLKSGGAFGLIHAKNTPLRKEQADEIKSRLLEMDASPENLSKIAGISAEIGFTRLSLTSDELKPFDFLNFDQKQICNVLRWDDLLLNNDAGAKYDNVGYARKRVITDDILPDLELLSEALNSVFLPRFKGYEGAEIIFDVSELPEMQEDMKEMVDWIKNAVDISLITRNEGREVIKFIKSDDPNMDIYTVQKDIISLDEAVNNDFIVDGK